MTVKQCRQVAQRNFDRLLNHLLIQVQFNSKHITLKYNIM
jgi:hypothetical protein